MRKMLDFPGLHSKLNLRFSCVTISPLLVFFLCCLYYFGWGNLLGKLILAAILHEVGHLMILLILRKKVFDIEFGCMGAKIKTESLSYAEEILCAVSGPLINLLLYAIFLGKDASFAACNLILALYNSLPVYPLDGGRVFKSVLCFFLSDLTAERISRIFNIIICLLFLLIALYLTAAYHIGLWPLLTAGMLFLKVGHAFDGEDKE